LHGRCLFGLGWDTHLIAAARTDEPGSRPAAAETARAGRTFRAGTERPGPVARTRNEEAHRPGILKTAPRFANVVRGRRVRHLKPP
jgi:hypothetical protein